MTTLWDYPSQHYGDDLQGDPNYRGATPSYVIWNLLQRYTQAGELVVDPCAGSGTTLDVARDLDRRALGYDIAPSRPDIFRVDARKLPPELTEKVDFVFIDPPYSTHLEYSDDPRCIGKLDAQGPEYYIAMAQVIREIHRVLKPGRHMGLYVSDSYVHNRGFFAIGFELFMLMRQLLIPVDIVAVTRHNKTLEMGNYRKAAEEGNFFLRGFNYLFIMRKPERGESIESLPSEQAMAQLAGEAPPPSPPAAFSEARKETRPRPGRSGAERSRRPRRGRGGRPRP